MYTRNAELLHLPSICIVESSIPAFAAAVAAPIRKLWPAKLMYGSPTASSALRISCVNFGFVKGWPFWNLKKGPSWGPLIAMYAVVAAIGHRGHPVLPTYTSTPLPSWSVLDRFSLIFSIVGSFGLSMATSPQLRWALGSKAFIDGTVISPVRKKPKKHKTDAAHSITISGFDAFTDQFSLILWRIDGVIGSLTLAVDVARCACVL